MASDDTTSQDSMVVGDDLVEALGFEPIPADEVPDEVPDVPSVGLIDSIEQHGGFHEGLDTGPVGGSVSGENGQYPAVEPGTTIEPELDVEDATTENEESAIEMATDDTDIHAAIDPLSLGSGGSSGSPEGDLGAQSDGIEVLTGSESPEPPVGNGGVIDLTADFVPAPPTEADLLAPAPIVESVPVFEFGPVGFDSGLAEPSTIDPVVPVVPTSLGGVELVGGRVPAEIGRRATLGAEKRRHRLRARKTRRVVRHVDPWSVLTFSIIFHLCFFAAMLLASVLVWNAAIAAGTVENIESFVRELGDYERFEIDSGKVFTAAILIAGMLTLASTIMVVLLTVVFNLISDLVGGIRVTVIEEETVRRPATSEVLEGTPQVVGGASNR